MKIPALIWRVGMAEIIIASASAFWLGVLTSISPCPLATNIAAISFVAQNVKDPRRVVVSGCLYTLGRSTVYVVLAVILVTSLLSTPHVSHALQKYMNKILGPILIIVGMILLNLIPIRWPGMSPGEEFQKRAGKMGMWGAGLLGVGFALSFCPISGALYFGSLLPLSLQHNSKILLPRFMEWELRFPWSCLQSSSRGVQICWAEHSTTLQKWNAMLEALPA